MIGLTRKDQVRVDDAVAALALDPRPMKAKKLEPKSANRYRLAVTFHVRVICAIDDAAGKILVLAAGQREGIY